MTGSNKKSVDDVEKELTLEFGALISTSQVWRLIGYPSSGAYRKARSRGSLPIKEISILGRRGHFVLAADLAKWLVGLNCENEDLKMK